MSSRNSRLSSEERKKATAIFHTLVFVKDKIAPGDLKALKKAAVKKLTEDGFKVDYVEVAVAESLLLTDHWDGKEKLVVLAAAYLNEVRLIDNLLVN
jgi:pantoate--beta-alanine ligase